MTEKQTLLVCVDSPLGRVAARRAADGSVSYRLLDGDFAQLVAQEQETGGMLVVWPPVPAGVRRPEAAMGDSERAAVTGFANEVRSTLLGLLSPSCATPTIFTDGSVADGRSGPAGWSCYVNPDNFAAGAIDVRSSQEIEVVAVLEAARAAVGLRGRMVIASDHQVTVRMIQRRSRPNRLAMQDLWDDLLDALDDCDVELRWVRGHARTLGNLRADQLAGLAARGELSRLEELESRWRQEDMVCEQLRAEAAARQPRSAAA